MDSLCHSDGYHMPICHAFTSASLHLLTWGFHEHGGCRKRNKPHRKQRNKEYNRPSKQARLRLCLDLSWSVLVGPLMPFSWSIFGAWPISGELSLGGSSRGLWHGNSHPIATSAARIGHRTASVAMWSGDIWSAEGNMRPVPWAHSMHLRDPLNNPSMTKKTFQKTVWRQHGVHMSPVSLQPACFRLLKWFRWMLIDNLPGSFGSSRAFSTLALCLWRRLANTMLRNGENWISKHIHGALHFTLHFSRSVTFLQQSLQLCLDASFFVLPASAVENLGIHASHRMTQQSQQSRQGKSNDRSVRVYATAKRKRRNQKLPLPTALPHTVKSFDLHNCTTERPPSNTKKKEENLCATKISEFRRKSLSTRYHPGIKLYSRKLRFCNET